MTHRAHYQLCKAVKQLLCCQSFGVVKLQRWEWPSDIFNTLISFPWLYWRRTQAYPPRPSVFFSEWHFYKKILEKFQNCMKLVESVRKSGSVFEASHKSVVSLEVSFLAFLSLLYVHPLKWTDLFALVFVIIYCFPWNETHSSLVSFTI